MTEAERGRERAMTLGVSTGVALAVTMLGVALWSHSLTLLADSVRAVLLTSLDCFVLVVLRRIHRGQLSGFEYGHGKLEHVLNLLIAAGLILGALGVSALGAIRSFQPFQPPPFGLNVAFVIAAVNASQNIWILAELRRAGRDGTSIILAGQIRARLTKVASSVMATLAILGSSVFHGGAVGLAADLAGVAVVVLIMLSTAFRLIEAALPHLLDRILDEPQQAAINRALIRHFHAYDALLYVRTRRSGAAMFIDIGLGYEPDRSMGEVDRINQAITAELKALIPGAEVTVTATACSAIAPEAVTGPAHALPSVEGEAMAGGVTGD